MFSRFFRLQLFRVFQNLLILTLGIFEVLDFGPKCRVFQCPGLTPLADHADFEPYVLMFSRLFWPWLVRVFQNLLILTLSIFGLGHTSLHFQVVVFLAGSRPLAAGQFFTPGNFQELDFSRK